jgi:hypothetical protein
MVNLRIGSISGHLFYATLGYTQQNRHTHGCGAEMGFPDIEAQAMTFSEILRIAECDEGIIQIIPKIVPQINQRQEHDKKDQHGR